MADHEKSGPPPPYPTADGYPQGSAQAPYPQQPAPSAYPQQQPGAYPQQHGGYPQQQAGAPGSYPGAPPPAAPYGAPPAQGVSSTTVVVTQPAVPVRLGPSPAMTTCQYCQAHVTTSVDRSCGGFVWMIAGIICLIGCFTAGITWLGCCLIPFCIPSLYDTTHHCPNCNRVIATHNHF